MNLDVDRTIITFVLLFIVQIHHTLKTKDRKDNLLYLEKFRETPMKTLLIIRVLAN